MGITSGQQSPSFSILVLIVCFLARNRHVAVQAVMLHHEDHVKEERDEGQAELARVTGHVGPVVVDDLGIYDKLEQAQQSTGKVECDALNGEPARRFAGNVEQDLWLKSEMQRSVFWHGGRVVGKKGTHRILDQRDDEFDVRAYVDKVDPAQDRIVIATADNAYAQSEYEDGSQDAEQDTTPERDLLSGRPFEHERGTELPEGDSECVNGKEGVVPADKVLLAVVGVAILLLDLARDQEGQVKDRIAKEAEEVQRQKV